MYIYARILEARLSLSKIDLPTKPVGTLLKELIDKKGMNPYSLARSSGVSHSQIVRILQNKAKRPKLETMVAFCIGLGLTYEESILFFRNAGYYDFKNENRFHNDIVLYTMILKIPGIDLVHANILLILGMYELIKRENSVSWMPSLVPSYLTAVDHIDKVYPDILSDVSQEQLLQNMYHDKETIDEIVAKLESIETEWEKSHEQ